MAEGLQRPEGVNIPKGRVRAEGVERSHVAAENIGEQQRMLGMKFYVTNSEDHCVQSLTVAFKILYGCDLC